jgi:hypothetical protein
MLLIFQTLLTRVFFAFAASILFVPGAIASVVYTYTSSPYTVGRDYDGQNAVQTYPPSNPFPTDNKAVASITFAAPLATNATIPVHAESGGYGAIAPNTSGLLDFGVSGFPSGITPGLSGITSDINAWATGPAVSGALNILRYAVLDGSINTDASGTILAWDLQFKLFELGANSFVWVDPGAKPVNFPPLSISNLDMGFFTSSAAPTSQTINNVIALNGVGNTSNYIFNAADQAFLDPGPVQHYRYTNTVGSWINPVVNAPTPATLPLISLAITALAMVRQRRKA